MSKLPSYLKKYFWDVKFEDLDSEKKPIYIIERVLEFGDLQAAQWLLKQFNHELIKRTLKEIRGLSFKSANFWGLYFKIPHDQILCFKKGFPNPPERIWNY